MKFLITIWLLPRNILIGPILLWKRFISPLYGNVCRYYPSCSTYGLAAIQRFGIVRGVPMTAWRILRCNPFSSGGVDDVPDTPRPIAISTLGFVRPDLSKRGN
ncbi:unannotated protein [freshwater metagenome]|uniref:Unannotated protein n=1 Tax=freshwater metagenome TaxID=449393 RepID=A0A6J6CES0_9ZZZZ